MATLVGVTDATFCQEVREAPRVLVFFWASWCGPCRQQRTTLEQMEDPTNGQVKFVIVDVDQCPTTSKEYNVRGIPTLLYFEGGHVVGQEVGAKGRRTVSQMINRSPS